MFSESDPYKILIRLAGVVIGVCCLMFFPSHIMAKALPVSYQSDEDTATSERDGKIDSFLGDLDKYKDNPEEALEDLKAWTQEQNEKEKDEYEENQEQTNKSVSVFFGGWAIFFIILTALYLFKFGLNIVTDSLRFLVDKITGRQNLLDLLRAVGAYLMVKYPPPPETPSEDETRERHKTKQKVSPSKTSKLE